MQCDLPFGENSYLRRYHFITDYYNKLNRIGDYENTNVRIKTIYEQCNTLNSLGLTIDEYIEYNSRSSYEKHKAAINECKKYIVANYYKEHK